MPKHIRGLTLLIAIAVLGTLAAIQSSCKSKTGVNFEGEHLPPKTMQKILLDINLAEAYSLMVRDSLHKVASKNTDSLAVYYRDIFAHYHITQEQFKESLDWYKGHATELDSVYNGMLAVTNKLQAIMPAPPMKIAPPPPPNRSLARPIFTPQRK